MVDAATISLILNKLIAIITPIITPFIITIGLPLGKTFALIIVIIGVIYLLTQWSYSFILWLLDKNQEHLYLKIINKAKPLEKELNTKVDYFAIDIILIPVIIIIISSALSIIWFTVIPIGVVILLANGLKYLVRSIKIFDYNKVKYFF